MGLFTKSFPEDEAFYVTCKNDAERLAVVELLKSNGFDKTTLNYSFETHPNIQVHQSDIHANARGGKYFSLWSLTPNGINTGKFLPIYKAKKLL